ncbi:MAG: Omp28-related outer membrane protein [Bacteroidia bacterium]|nr:Omp28-related outer membrane protein [Bacteroidia bacterium]
MRTLLRSSLLACVLLLPVLSQAQTARTPLLEQFTGTWCQWCPYGADSVNALLGYLPNARALAYHGGSASEPMKTTEGDAIIAHLLVGGYPTAAIDRLLINTPQGTAIAISRSYWGNVMTQRHATTAPMSIGVSGTYHQDTREINMNVTLNILQDLSGEFYLNVVLSEDNLNYAQVKNVGGSVVTLNPYYHKRVVRKMITGAYGTTISTNGFQANQVVTQPITYTVPGNYDITQCKIAVFVTTKVTLTVNGQPRPTNMAVQQAWQEPVLSALSTIPVELISFNAVQVDDNVRLEWRTASESNNKGWTVERRALDGEWTDLGFVAGKGTTLEDNMYTFTDRAVRPLETYDYRLRQMDFDGTTEHSPIFRIMVAPVPTETRMHPNYPNPFNPSTSIVVELAEDSDMHVAVYDMLGRVVKTLATGAHSAGGHVLDWDGTDSNGAAVEAGIYFARMVTPTHSQTIQMQMVK